MSISSPSASHQLFTVSATQTENKVHKKAQKAAGVAKKIFKVMVYAAATTVFIAVNLKTAWIPLALLLIASGACCFKSDGNGNSVFSRLWELLRS